MGEIVDNLKLLSNLMTNDFLYNIFGAAIEQCKNMFTEVAQTFTNIDFVNKLRRDYEAQIAALRQEIERWKAEHRDVVQELAMLKREVQMNYN